MMRKIIFGFVCVIMCSACSVTDDVKDFDLVILNGRVMDPETGLDAVKNIGVKNGKIVSITQQELQGIQSIDARGLVVAPGFIDLHNHSQNPEGYQRSVQDGVTTTLELETGVFPITPWFERHKNKARANYGASVSHGYIRARVMGGAELSMFEGDYEIDGVGLYELPHWNRDKATPGQMDAMKKLVAQEIDAGGLGIGYHLVVTPGSDVNEMLDFYALSARKKVANFIHIRSVGQVSPIESGREIIHAAKTKGASIHVVHINSSGLWETRELLDMLYKAQKQGLDVSTEVYPYDAAPTTFRDPRVTRKGGLEMFRIGYADLELMSTNERLTEETFKFNLENNPDAGIIAHIMNEQDIVAAIAHPMVMIASDGVDLEEGRGHPRGAATFSRVLGKYVRQDKLISLMDALGKMTIMPAKRLENFAPGMKLRGRLQEGMVADITVFNPETIIDKANYIEADIPSAGIAHVIVNGQSVVQDYSLKDGVFPGQAIRSMAAH